MSIPLVANQNQTITFSQFTQSDKKSVMQKFMSNLEVLFLVYGLMFPSRIQEALEEAGAYKYLHGDAQESPVPAQKFVSVKEDNNS